MTSKQEFLSPAPDILVVDDTIASLRMLTDILSNAGYKPRPVEDPHLALEASLAQPPDLILLDVRMPKMSGFELSRRLKHDKRTSNVPIIFVSALEDTEDRVKGFEVGGLDFISKPIQEAEVLARVKTHLQLRYTQLHLENLVASRTAELSKMNKALKKEINQRVRAEEEIRKSEEKFRGVFNSMTDVFTRSDMEGTCLIVSPSIYDMMGYTPEELIGRNLEDLYAHPEEREEIVKKLLQLKRKENFEFDAVCKDGQTITVSNSAKIVYNSEGEPVFVEGNIRDISNQKKAEAEHKKLFHVSFDLLCIAGFDGYFKELNPAWEKVTGYTLDELHSLPFNKFLHPADVEKTENELKKLSEGKVSIDFENRYITKSGNVLNLSWTVIPMPENDRLYCIARDVTARKVAEDNALAYQQRLKDLAYEITITEEIIRKQIAVDLHDHVGQILASSRLRIAGINESTDIKDILKILKNISSGLYDAIDSTRNAIFELSPPQLNEIGLAAAISDWMGKELRQYNINYDLEGDAKKLPLSNELRYLLFRCLRELLVNVIKHSTASNVVVSFKEQNSTVLISVHDNGIGFNYNPDVQKIKDSGFGLLSIIERIESIDGEMFIDTAPGKGTNAVLKIPL